jgi:hypothetical protein
MNCGSTVLPCSIGLLLLLLIHVIHAFGLQGDPNTCGYIRPEVPNVKMETQERGQAIVPQCCDCCVELKSNLTELEQTLDSVLAELCKMKAKPAEAIPEAKLEQKQIVIDFYVFVGFVGLLVGVVLACMWK